MAIYQVELANAQSFERAFSSVRPDICGMVDSYINDRGNDLARSARILAREAFLFGLVRIPGTYQGALPAYFFHEDMVMVASSDGDLAIRTGLSNPDVIIKTLEALYYGKIEGLYVPNLPEDILSTLVGFEDAITKVKIATGPELYPPRDPQLPEIDILGKVIIPGKKGSVIRVVP